MDDEQPTSVPPEVIRMARLSAAFSLVGLVLFTVPLVADLSALTKAICLTVAALGLAVSATLTIRVRARMNGRSS